MSNFKVICKSSNDTKWHHKKGPELVTKTFFGFFSQTRVEDKIKIVDGPSKDEICIVTDSYISKGETYYILAGYPYGGYNSKYFVRLDEFTETAKDIAHKAERSVN